MLSSVALERGMKGLRDVEDIVGAMKAYAGVTVRKAEEMVLNIRVCEQNALRALATLAATFPRVSVTAKGAGKRILVVFGSSLGLCGVYNEAMSQAVSKLRQEGDALIVIGRRLQLLVEACELSCAARLEAPASVDGIRGALPESVSRIRELYSLPEYYRLVFLYTAVSGSTAETMIEPILPPDLSTALPAASTEPPLLYQEPETVFAGILEEFLLTSLHRCYLESLRSENWYRSRAMEGASENLKRRNEELRSQYNYVRQEEITEEMLEILGGGMFFGRPPERPE